MNKEAIKKLALQFQNLDLPETVRIMEVCGTHTTEFFRTGVRDILPDQLRLVDGPGCPVCVTSNEYLDRAIEIGKRHNAIIATFGDMIKVPSSYSSLGKEKSNGMDVEVVYSPLDAVRIAESYPDREVVFISVGFETTSPSEAVTVLEARKRNAKNFSLLTGNKLTPPAVKALLDSEDVNIDGFILPGHVSAIIGVDGWRFISNEYKKPCVISGFENHDLMRGSLILLNLIKTGRFEIINAYTRVVKEEGNRKAQEIMYHVFEKCHSHWRGIGIIPESGLSLREKFSEFNAIKKFPVSLPPTKEPTGCKCGELLRGLITPDECSLFAKTCTPEHPIGPCMVSTEGPCAAFYKYRRH
ncbi:MAG: hydrogenase formation protein HypD [Spirochaetota bacterium]|nr:hydrogenase formation protein HypD [Spirochaetota bacterium]